MERGMTTLIGRWWTVRVLIGGKSRVMSESIKNTIFATVQYLRKIFSSGIKLFGRLDPTCGNFTIQYYIFFKTLEKYSTGKCDEKKLVCKDSFLWWP